MSTPTDPIARQAEITLGRLLPRLESQFGAGADAEEWAAFKARLQRNFLNLFRLLLELYGRHYDFFYHLESILATAARMWLARSPDLKKLDKVREADPLWFQSEKMLGGVCYVGLFAGDLDGVRQKIPYFKELGLTYLHLMPLFLSPEGNNDGGYAISSYRHVDPDLGSMEELASLAADLRHNGISLVLDFVFNHTSDEHEWARLALAGDPDHQAYYFIFPDRTMPDAYERTLREIFPDQRPGNFTFRPEVGWVWTTFNSFQWDLNYSNPAVFNSMAEEMLSLANRGAEVLRLDALAFTWKELGTSCENLPQVHTLVRAFNAIARIAAPLLLFKSEAIVHPDYVIEYISEEECQLSYNPLLMALLWEALATRDVKLLQLSMRERFQIGHCCAWVNYVRSHDDIGWTFDDGDAAQLGINGFYHRQFLNAFYTGRFPGSFARGVPFQENPRTGDARISGTCASLSGLEEAVHEEDPALIELAIRRILLIYSVILSIGGIPLIYLGDEVGTLNDYAYRNDPAKAEDSRWVHRPYTDWSRIARREQEDTIEGRIYGRLHHLVNIRKDCPAIADGDMELVEAGNPHIFAYVRHHAGGRVLIFANFSEQAQTLPANVLRLHGLGYTFKDLVSGQTIQVGESLVLEPYQFVWLA
ncbi:MAG TPA: alpha-amylase family glycosyl hydrolase [Chloroflexia bacterium]|nr:alpha-amylase family glycosyl hydrolase [Chloroflexia bacterium]